MLQIVDVESSTHNAKHFERIFRRFKGEEFQLCISKVKPLPTMRPVCTITVDVPIIDTYRRALPEGSPLP